MPDLATLRDLQRRLREATGPDRELDEAIAIVAHNLTSDRKIIGVACSALVTSSIDAIRSAVRQVFPNARIMIDEWPDHACVMIQSSFRRFDEPTNSGEAPTAPLAACLALVSALIAVEEREAANG